MSPPLDRLRKLRSRVAEHWPIKVTALILSAVLWVATKDEPTNTGTAQRVLSGVPIEVRDATEGRAWQVTPDAVTAVVSGPALRVARLTADSIHAVVFVADSASRQVGALTLLAPPGVSASSAVRTVRLRQRQ